MVRDLLSLILDSDEMMINHYNFELQGREFVFAIIVGSFLSFILGLFTPAAGPDWMWAGGRNDVIRSLYFRSNGTFRRFGRAALFLTLIAGSAAVLWMLQRL